MWGLSPSDNNAQIDAYKAQYGISNPCAGTEGGGPGAINTVIAGQPFYGYPTYVVVCPDNTMSFDVCWPPPGAYCFDPYIQDCIDNTLVAGFNSDLTEICETQEVQFQDNSVGNIITWSWVFEGGDPATSADQNPTVTYSYAGIYDVELTVSNGTSSNTMLIEDFITVNALPGTTLQPFADVCLTWPAFELTGGFPEGGAYSGNGVNGGLFDPMVAGLGTHTITYTYTDPEGCLKSAMQDIYVDPCTGIPEQGIMNMMMFPNPSPGIFILQASITGLYFVQVIDLLGTVVYESDGVSDKTFKKEINLTKEGGGIYFVKVKSGDEYCIRKLRLVK
jgi:PKD repeat protein